VASTPRRYGWTWDVTVRDTTANTPCGGEDFGVSHIGGIGALGEVCNQSVEIDGRPVSALAFTSLHGDSIGPSVLAGRSPRGPHEVALGSSTLAALHKRIGDTVGVKGRAARRTFEIVGRAALPTLGQGQPLADGALFTGPGFAPLFDQNLFQRYFVMRFAPDADVISVTHRLAAVPQLGPPAGPTRPVELERLRQINWLPVTIGMLLGALGFLGLVHALVTTVRLRRREFAVLRTLGFDRWQVRATMAWQATTLATVGLLVGIPVGWAAGNTVWREVAERLGVSPASAIPLLAAFLMVPTALVLVDLSGLLLARVPARLVPAAALGAE
jgi:hypothetical protein